MRIRALAWPSRSSRCHSSRCSEHLIHVERRIMEAHVVEEVAVRIRGPFTRCVPAEVGTATEDFRSMRAQLRAARRDSVF
eukprot:8338016-Heterocapsa_arctica.AAC.1